MNVHVWGTDFHRGNRELRSALFVPPEDRVRAHAEWLQLGFKDLVYLPTCNRIEFYMSEPNPFRDTRTLWVRLLEWFGLPPETYFRGYHFEGKSAVRHVVRVASSLESLVVGEPQILGQLKEAFAWVREQGHTVEPALEKTFSLAFETAKRVRTETDIAEGSVSVASLAFRSLERQEAFLPVQTAVVVGRGQISRLAVQWFLSKRPQCRVVWVNRSVETIESFAAELSAGSRLECVALRDFLNQPIDFSHLVTATASTEALFTDAFFRKLNVRKRLCFDLAQPPDILCATEGAHGAEIIDLEGVRAEAEENAQKRAKSVELAEGVIEEAVREFCLRQKGNPILRDFNRIEPRFLEEMQSALQDFEADLPPELQAKFRKWTEKLVRKNLHTSREFLRSALTRISEGELSTDA